MANPFDQFDAPPERVANPFDQFDDAGFFSGTVGSVRRGVRQAGQTVDAVTAVTAATLANEAAEEPQRIALERRQDPRPDPRHWLPGGPGVGGERGYQIALHKWLTREGERDERSTNAARFVEQQRPYVSTLLGAIARSGEEIESIPQSTGKREYDEAKGLLPALEALRRHPFDVTAGVAAESLPASLPSLVLGALGSAGGPAGTAAGAGVGSLVMEYGGTMLDALQSEGYDLRRPETLAPLLENPEALATLRSKAARRGVPVALFDAVSAGIAGRLLRTPAKTVLGKIGQGAAEIGIQGGLGGAGEAAGAVAAGEEIDPKAVLGEILGEVGSGAGEVATGAIRDRLLGVNDTGKNIPESAATLEAQQEQLVRGLRPAQMFPLGTDELPLPKGMQRVETERGVFHFNPRLVTADDILTASKRGRENDVLALGPMSKEDVDARVAQGDQRVAVTERTPDGTEVKTAVATRGTAPGTAAALEQTKMPGNAIAVEPIERVPAERLAGKTSQPPREQRSTAAAEKRSTTLVEELLTREAKRLEEQRETEARELIAREKRQKELADKRARFDERIGVARDVMSRPDATFAEVNGALESVKFYAEDNSLGLAQEQRETAARAQAALARRLEGMQATEQARREREQQERAELARAEEALRRERRKEEQRTIAAEAAAGISASGQFDYKSAPMTALDQRAEQGDARAVDEIARRSATEGDSREELLAALREVKLPSTDEALGGELEQLVREGMTPQQRMDLVSRKHTSLDRTAEALRERGFTRVQTPADVLDVVGRALRGEKIYADTTGEGQVEFATGKPTGGGFTTLKALRDAWTQQGVQNFASERDGVITLAEVRVPKERQNQGLGTQFMRDLIAYADRTGQQIALSPSTDFGGSSLVRLKEFYRRFGFRENKGRRKDFRISESMRREVGGVDFATAAATAKWSEPDIEREIAAIRKAAPQLVRENDVQIGNVRRALQNRGYQGKVPAEVQAAILRQKGKRTLIALSARAYRDRAKGAGLLIHETAHAYWDMLPEEVRNDMRELHAQEVRDKTGPLYRDGVLQTELEFVEDMDERGHKEWFAERMARLHEDWLKGKIDRAEQSFMRRAAHEIREFIRNVWAALARSEDTDPETDLFERQFRRWFESGGRADIAQAAGEAYARAKTPDFAQALLALDTPAGVRLPDDIRNLQPRWQEKRLAFESSLDKALYYAGGTNSETRARVVASLAEQTGLSEGQIASAARTLREKLAPIARSAAADGEVRVPPLMRQSVAAITGVEFATGNVAEVFRDAFRRWRAGTLERGFIFRLGRAVEGLVRGGLADAPIELKQSVLRKAVNHGVGDEALQQLPDALARPVAVFDTHGDPARRIVLTDLRDPAGKSVLAAFEVTTTPRGNTINDMRTAQGREAADVHRWIADGKTTWADKNRALAWLMSKEEAPLTEATHQALRAQIEKVADSPPESKPGSSTVEFATGKEEPADLQRRYDALREQFDTLSAEAEELRAEITALENNEVPDADVDVHVKRDQLRENERSTKAIYAQLAALRQKLEQANPTKPKLPEGKTPDQVIAEAAKVEALPKVDRKAALLAEWRYGKELRDKAVFSGNRTVEEEGERLMKKAKARLDDEFPGWKDDGAPAATPAEKARWEQLDEQRQKLKRQLRALENGPLGDAKREQQIRDELEATREEFQALDRKVRPQAYAETRATPPPAEPAAADESDLEKSPFAEPEKDMPVRAGKANEVFGHTSYTPGVLTRSWQKVRDALIGIKGSVPELPTFGAAFWNKSDNFIREHGPNFYDGIKAFYRKLVSANDGIQRQAEDDVAKITKPLIEAGGEFSANDYAKLQRLQEWERRAQAEGKRVDARRSATIAALQSKLETHPYVLFNRLIYFLDANWRATNLKDDQGNPIVQAGGLNEAESKAELQRLGKKVAASDHEKLIRTALEQHMALVKRVADDLKKRELMAVDALQNPFYFPHLTLEVTRGGKTEQRELRPERVRPGTEADFRGYLQDPKGSLKNIESDYVRAMYYHLVQVGAHNAKADAVRDYARPYDIKSQVEATAKKLSKERDYTVSWLHAFHEKYEPRGYVLYGTNSREAFPSITVDRDKLARRLGVMLTSDDLQRQLEQLGLKGVKLLPEDLRETLQQGERETWIVPARVAEALRGIQDRESRTDNPLEAALKWTQSQWKAWKLFMPQSHIRYEFGNVVGDVEKLVSASPQTFKYLPEAAKEVREFWLGGEPSEDLRAAVREGVINTITAQEMDRLQRQPNFRAFETAAAKLKAELKAAFSAPLANLSRLTPNSLARATSKLTGADSRIARITKALAEDGLIGRVNSVEESAFREAVFRYAKFKGDLKALRAGARPAYAGAYARDVDAMQDSRPGAGDANVRKAAAISKATFGDYGDISVTGHWLREKLIPFYSWTEVNFKYHANLLRNLRDMVRAGEASQAEAMKAGARAAAVFAAGFTARAAGAVMLRLALPYLAVYLWNNSGDRDELEKELSEEDRRTFHIILGRNAEGKVELVKLNTAFMDVMKWFSGPKFAQAMAGWMTGKTDFVTAFSAWRDSIGPDFLNNTVGQMGPLVRVPYTYGSKKNPFPDITDQRTIPEYDMRRVILGQAFDEATADMVERLVNKDYYASKDVGDWLKQMALQIRQRDPEQWAFYAIKDKAAEFEYRMTGERYKPGEREAKGEQVVRNFRRAIYRGDIDKAVQFYLQLLDYGYTAERFAGSIRGQDPLSELDKKSGLRRAFVESLTPTDRELLKRAYAYYTRINASKGREAVLFPRKASGERGLERYRAAPRTEQLRRMMETVDERSDDEELARAERALRDSLKKSR